MYKPTKIYQNKFLDFTVAMEMGMLEFVRDDAILKNSMATSRNMPILALKSRCSGDWKNS